MIPYKQIIKLPKKAVTMNGQKISRPSESTDLNKCPPTNFISVDNPFKLLQYLHMF
jgi:hypothetical protein